MTEQQLSKLDNAITTIESKLLTGNDLKSSSFERQWLKAFIIENQGLQERYILEFLHRAQITGANPITKQIYLLSFFDKKKGHKVGTTVFDYNFLRTIASQVGIMTERINAYTEVMDIFNPYSGESEKQLVGIATYTNKDGTIVMQRANFNEYKNQMNHIWKSKPHTMIQKCAEAGLLRRIAPQGMSGMYIKEEMEGERQSELVEVESIEAMETDIKKPVECDDVLNIVIKPSTSKRKNAGSVKFSLPESSK